MTAVPNHYQKIADLAFRGHLTGAEKQCLQSLQETDDPELVYMLAVIKGRQNNYAAALELFEKAVGCLPDRSDIIYNFGVFCQAYGDLERAVALWQRAAALNPAMQEVHYNLGKAFSQLNQMDRAETSYRQALTHAPTDAQTLYNLGNLRFQQDDFEGAEELFRKAIRARPSWDAPWVNMGMTQSRLGRYSKAETCFCEALNLNPGNADAHWNRSLLLLTTGNYEDGWLEYEWRFERDEWQSFYPYRHRVPRWSGRPFAGKRLLVHDEQGLGDALQFLRFLPMVKELGGTVVFETNPRLIELLKDTDGADEVVPRPETGFPVVSYDMYVPLLSLPALFGITWQTVPNRTPYLKANRTLSASWAQKLTSISGFKIGICWQGNPAYKADRQRSVPLKYFAPLAKIEDIALISLQKIHGLEQLSEMPSDTAIMDLGRVLDEDTGVFMDTAAVMQNLDLIITSDTAIPHLAGALGVPVWLVLPQPPDWRWGLNGDHYPWYPTMRVFRQRNAGDWEDLFETVCDAVRQHIS
jgi:Tfp pilus assembly protein PilF